MADLAIRGEPSRNVVRIRRRVELRLMTRNARGTQADEHPAGVAVRTGKPGVCAGEWKQRFGMIKSCAEPGGGAVA